MKMGLIVVGKTTKAFVAAAYEEYTARLKHYGLEWETLVINEIRDAKNLPVEVLKAKEGDEILRRIQPSDHVVLLDEKGQEFTSVAYAESVRKLMGMGKRIVWVIGGAYGFGEKVYARANGKVSLSKMTFSHQLIRAIFAEQIYRAMTIVKGERYHHE